MRETKSSVPECSEGIQVESFARFAGFETYGRDALACAGTVAVVASSTVCIHAVVRGTVSAVRAAVVFDAVDIIEIITSWSRQRWEVEGTVV